MDLSNTTITTQRLILKPLSLDYLSDIFRELTDEITLYMSFSTPKNIDETKVYINSQLPKIMAGEQLPVVILDKKTGDFIGCGGAHDLFSDIPELGIWIKKSAHGNHYGKEAVASIKKWIDSNINYKYIKYPVDKRNLPSRKIAESLGGIVEAEYESKTPSGKILEEVEYRIYK